MDARIALGGVWRVAPRSMLAAYSSPVARTSNTASLYHNRYLSTTLRLRQQAPARKEAEDEQERPDAAATQPRQPPTLQDRFQNARERQKSSPPNQTRKGLGGDLDFLTTPKAASQSQTQPNSRSSATNDLLSSIDNDSSLDFLDPKKNPSRFPSPSSPRNARSSNASQSAQSSQPSQPNQPKPKGSFKDELARMIAEMRANPQSNRQSSSGRVDTSRMLSPQRPAGYDPMEFSLQPIAAPVDTSPPTFRISPSLGRTVAVDDNRNMDLARAFRSLEIKCNVNSVKQDMNKQRFHERPGMKRKRLVSERWRRRFKEAFRATVRRVEDMRRKGW